MSNCQFLIFPLLVSAKCCALWARWSPRSWHLITCQASNIKTHPPSSSPGAGPCWERWLRVFSPRVIMLAVIETLASGLKESELRKREQIWVMAQRETEMGRVEEKFVLPLSSLDNTPVQWRGGKRKREGPPETMKGAVCSVHSGDGDCLSIRMAVFQARSREPENFLRELITGSSAVLSNSANADA